MTRLAGVVAALLLSAAGGCSEEPQVLSVTDAYVRLPAVQGRPAAAYFTLHGGAEPTQLLSISSAVAIRTEVHETVTTNGVAAMRPLGDLAVPAGAVISFQPGGRHAMLFRLNPGITPARRVPLTFSFGNGVRVTVNAPVVAAGSPAPEAE